jgi:hypothetical protein
MGNKKYWVLSDSDSVVECKHTGFDNYDDADDFAFNFVHQYDGWNAERVIVHIDDDETDTTIATYENINKCDGLTEEQYNRLMED